MTRSERDPTRLVAEASREGAGPEAARAGALLRELTRVGEPTDAAVHRVRARVMAEIGPARVARRLAWATTLIVLVATSAGATVGIRLFRRARQGPATRLPRVMGHAPPERTASVTPLADALPGLSPAAPAVTPSVSRASMSPIRAVRAVPSVRRTSLLAQRTALRAPPIRPEDVALAEARTLSAALRRLRTDKDPAGALALLDAGGAPARVLVDETALVRVEALLLLGRKPEALAVLEARPIAIPSQQRQIAVVRGELAADLDRCGDAIEPFTQALSANPPGDELSERALFGRAGCRARLGLHAGSESDLRSYLQRFPRGRFAAPARAAIDSR